MRYRPAPGHPLGIAHVPDVPSGAGRWCIVLPRRSGRTDRRFPAGAVRAEPHSREHRAAAGLRRRVAFAASFSLNAAPLFSVTALQRSQGWWFTWRPLSGASRERWPPMWGQIIKTRLKAGQDAELVTLSE